MMKPCGNCDLQKSEEKRRKPRICANRYESSQIILEWWPQRFQFIDVARARKISSMDPIQEILETVRAMRATQVESRQTQLEAVRRVRRFVLFGGVFFGIIILAYVLWCWFIIAHGK
jgi:hypothetical protein